MLALLRGQRQDPDRQFEPNLLVQHRPLRRALDGPTGSTRTNQLRRGRKNLRAFSNFKTNSDSAFMEAF